MDDKLHRDMDLKIYESLKKILNYDKKRLIVLSKKRRSVFNEELDKIQHVDNIRLIKYLLILCFDKDLIIASRALKHLKRIMDNLTIKELLFFAEYFRSKYYGYYIDCHIQNRYKEVNMHRVDLIDRFGKEGIYILAILTLHPDGHVREDSLRKLLEFEHGFKIKFVMIRVNDWVKPIRDFAKKELIKYIKDEYIKDIIECILIIERMNNWGRDDFLDIVFKLEELIINERNYKLLLDMYENSEERLVRRKLFKYLLEINRTIDLIINIGLKSKDIVILRDTIEKIHEVINEDNEELIYKALKKNKNLVCKIAAINILEKMNVPDFHKVLIPFMYNKSYILRHYARYKLKEKGITNFREMYLDEIDKENYNLNGIIFGIKETGNKGDINYILKYLEHEKVNIRKTALSTIYKLNYKEGIEYAIDKLVSDNISESNNAKKCLENNILLLDENMIFELFELEGYEDHVYMNLIKLINHYPKWDGILQLLKILKISSGTYIKMINYEIELWINKFNRSFIQPRKEQVDIIRNIYMMANNKLSSDNSLQIGYILKGV
ncbi:MAG: hypothetical protein N4A57_14355 [Anaeromicrobium sp.]|jgi:hypothetical protein|uniref:hypothetical protein n=1 Tax=Anaeromicrobium sp. TaxID=1929132 RepID=UPI0025DF7B41|nr:hypothetical protein [Anaeromicrobium sp.]MCT4595430.1 hypothetical protein [Anaeromicrobium sp.]